MKIKDGEDLIMYLFVFIIILPIALIYLFFKLLLTPVDYLRYKRSRYQKDFPHKFTWLVDSHFDNGVYTVIKENDLPIEYIKWSKDYYDSGYFVYKDILLDFCEPFFYDEEEKAFFLVPDENGEETAQPEASDENMDGKEKEERLTVSEGKEKILKEFRQNVPGRECGRIVFFQSYKDAERDYKKEGVDVMRGLDDFIIYEKSELKNQLEAFIYKN